MRVAFQSRRPSCCINATSLCFTVTTDPDTFANAQMRSGYDAGFGWIRSPAMSQMHYYIATHPKVYVTFVALIATELLHKNYPDNLDHVRACVELRLQSYNTKLHLPSLDMQQFTHCRGR